MKKAITSSLALITMVGCAHLPPPPQRTPTIVNAPFSKVWDAVIDQAGDTNTPIANMDRTSGFIATQPMQVVGDRGWATCRAVPYTFITVVPQYGTFNLVVRSRPDSTSTTIRATAAWSGARMACTSTGQWEREFEEAIKARAEGRASFSPAAPKMGAVGEGTRMYEQPDEESRTVYRFTGSTDVQVIATSETWTQVRFGTRQGWVRSNRIRIQ